MRREWEGVSGAAGRGAGVAELARAALDRAVAHLLARQNADGWW